MRKLLLCAAISMSVGTVAAAGENIEVHDHDFDDKTITVVFSELDRDGDERIDRSEAESMDSLYTVYGDLDLNGDGYLDDEEFAAVHDWDDMNDAELALVTDLNDYAVDGEFTAYDADRTDDTVHTPDPDVFDPDWEDTNDADASTALAIEGEMDEDLDPETDLDMEAGFETDLEEDRPVDGEYTAYDADKTDDTVHTPDPDLFDPDWEDTNDEDASTPLAVEGEFDDDLDLDAEAAADVDSELEVEATVDSESTAYDEDSTDDVVHTPDPDQFDSDWADTNDADASTAMTTEIEADADVEGDTAAELDVDSEATLAAEIDLNEVEYDAERELLIIKSTGAADAIGSQDVSAVFTTTDANSDRAIDRSEADAIDGLAAAFAQLDTDNDGEIDVIEFNHLVAANY